MHSIDGLNEIFECLTSRSKTSSFIMEMLISPSTVSISGPRSIILSLPSGQYALIFLMGHGTTRNDYRIHDLAKI